MRILFFASHLLHHRSLTPVICELAHRGHSITVQRNRPNWMGMPTFQMNWTPTRVTGVNKASLAWLADRIGYGQDWQAAQDHVDYARHFVPEEYDAAVSTPKDMHFLGCLTEETKGGMTAYAVGYQHLPIVMRLNRGPFTYFDIPKPLWGHHPFADLHKFEDIYYGGTGRSCGFPHLDKVQIYHSRKQNAVLIQHHGGYRGLRGHTWLAEIVRTITEAGYEALICPHFIPGYGYDRYAIIKALDRKVPGGNWRTVNHWWDVAGSCDLILTTGSSAAYEMWAVGLTNVFILGYAGGTRHEKFRLFQDLLVESPKALAKLLSLLPGSAQATEPLTREVMEAYRSVHNGHGAKTAADVIEGEA